MACNNVRSRFGKDLKERGHRTCTSAAGAVLPRRCCRCDSERWRTVWTASVTDVCYTGFCQTPGRDGSLGKSRIINASGFVPNPTLAAGAQTGTEVADRKGMKLSTHRPQ